MATVSLTGRFEFVWVIVLQNAYVYYFVLRMRKGTPRLLALLPILPFSFLVPWRRETGPERGTLAFLFLWMMMSKLLMLVWNIGPGADLEVLSSFPRFLSDMTLALHVKRETSSAASKKRDDSEEIDRKLDEDSSESRKKDDPEEIGRKMDEDGNGRGGSATVVRRKSQASSKGNGKSSAVQVDDVANKTRKGIMSKVYSTVSSMISTLTTSLSWQMVLLRSTMYFIFSVIWLRLVLSWKPFKSVYVEDATLLIMLYLMCLFLFEGCAAVPASIFGAELHPQFNMPYLSTSLADFWGRRWNLLINNLLRVSVYDPVIKFFSTAKVKPSDRDKGIAMMAAFLVSGLEHELIFFYMNKTPPSWQMTTYFVLNGAGTVVEGLVKPRERGMPTFLRRAYTLTFLFFTTNWLFFPPLRNTGMIDQNLADLQVFTLWIQRPLLKLVGLHN